MPTKEKREGEFECDEFRARWDGGSLTFNFRDDWASVDRDTAQQFSRWLSAMVSA